MRISELGLKPVTIFSHEAFGHPQRTPYLRALLLCLAGVAFPPTSCRTGHIHHSAASTAVFKRGNSFPLISCRVSHRAEVVSGKWSS